MAVFNVRHDIKQRDGADDYLNLYNAFDLPKSCKLLLPFYMVTASWALHPPTKYLLQHRNSNGRPWEPVVHRGGKAMNGTVECLKKHRSGPRAGDARLNHLDSDQNARAEDYYAGIGLSEAA